MAPLSPNSEMQGKTGVRTNAADVAGVTKHVISEALIGNDHFHKTLLNNSPDCVKVLDTEGRLLWMNERGQRLMEICDINPMLGACWIDFWSEPYKEAAAEAVCAASQNQVRRFTGACATPKGTWKWWDVAVTPIIGRAGSVDYLLSVSRDVTEYMALCRDRDDCLERERQLRVDLEKANRKRDYALLAAAHELGAPLYAVRGWAQFLQIGEPAPCDWADGIAAIEMNTRRLQDVVEQLLEVARFRSTQVSLSCVVNSVSEVIAEAVRGVEAAARAKQIAIGVDLASDANACADFQQLERAFSNILFNAVKFTPQNGMISVRCSVEHASIVAEIADTGIGIPARFLEDIFEPFSQCSTADGRSNIGMGLGLSIARRIFEAHGGTVQASSPGETLGSTFTVTLPLSPHHR